LEASRAIATSFAAERWRETWQRCWRSHRAEEIIGLYAGEVVFQPHPFKPPLAPREFIERVFADEKETECEFGSPICDGDRAAVEWTAKTTLKDGQVETLAGVSLLRFSETGSVVEQRDFWAEANVEPQGQPSGAGTRPPRAE
jgi:hypothetical protein